VHRGTGQGIVQTDGRCGAGLLRPAAATQTGTTANPGMQLWEKQLGLSFSCQSATTW